MAGPTPVSRFDSGSNHGCRRHRAGFFALIFFTPESLALPRISWRADGLICRGFALKGARWSASAIRAYSDLASAARLHGMPLLVLECQYRPASSCDRTLSAKALTFLGSGSVIHARHREAGYFSISWFAKRMPPRQHTLLA